MPEDKPIKCPNCGSIQLTSSNKESFGWFMKLVFKIVLVFSEGFLSGSSDIGKREITCIACKYKWKPEKI